jgi:Domain of unknown function (DUF1707)
VSQEERESVVELLRDGYVAAWLDHAQFDERSTAAYAAKTWGQLADQVADLPVAPLRAADLPAAGVPWTGTRDRGRTAISGRRRRGVLLVALLTTLVLLIAGLPIPGAMILSGILAICVLGGGMPRRR